MKAVKEVEMVYGIHFGERVGEYNAPCEREEAECIISENQSDEALIAQMINADFLNQWTEYMVIDNKCSIHIHHKINGKQGGIALVLIYKEDVIVEDTNAIDKEMKEWLLECFSDEYDQEQIEELTHEQLVRSINRYFDGGLKEFMNCISVGV